MSQAAEAELRIPVVGQYRSAPTFKNVFSEEQHVSRFVDAVFLVTGAARGIGAAIARRLLYEGAFVAAADRDLEPIVAAMQSVEHPTRWLPLHIDVADETSVVGALAELEKRSGVLHGLVNNAAILDATPLDMLTSQRFRAVLDINLTGALACSLAAAPLLARTGASSIVNIGSIMGLYGQRAAVPYATAKAGLLNLTRCLAVELAPSGITVNTVAPGFVGTRMSLLPDGSSEYATEEFQDVYVKHRKLPAGRVGTPEDIAGATAFLLSDDARYITGQTLVVDGGVTATY